MGLKLDNRQEVEPTIVDAATTADITYVGYVAPNADADDLEQVAIKRIDETVSDVTTIKWADGDKNFDNAWANRASLTYEYLKE